MRMFWINLLAVAGGGLVGAVCRYLVGVAARAFLPTFFPFGTLLVNIGGSLLLGILIGLSLSAAGLSPLILALVGTGFCGAFTTFSTFTTDTLTSNNVGTAILNVVVNNAAAFAAAALGMYIGRSIGG